MAGYEMNYRVTLRLFRLEIAYCITIVPICKIAEISNIRCIQGVRKLRQRTFEPLLKKIALEI